MGANFRGAHPAHQPERRPQPGRQGPPATGWSGGRRDLPRPADRRGRRLEERVRIVNHAERRDCRGRGRARARRRRRRHLRGPRLSATRPADRCCRSPRPTAGDVPLRRARRGRAARRTSPSRSPPRPSSPSPRRSRRVRQRRRGPPALDRDDGRRRAARAELDDLVDRAPGERRRSRGDHCGGAGCAVPADPPGVAGRGRRGVPRLGARDDVRPDRPRAVQPRDPALGARTCACSINEGPGPDQRYIAAGVPWFATLFGRDALIASFQALAFRPQIAVETLAVLAAYQATEPTTVARRGARQDPPRAADRRDGRRRRAAPHAVLRLGRLDAALADPARRDVRLDRRSRVRRPALAERAGRARLDRPLRRSGRRRVRRVRAALGARAPQPGLEGLERRDPRPIRPARPMPPIALAEVQGYVFDAKRRMAGLAAVRGEDELASRLAGRGRGAPRSASRSGVLGRGPALLRDGARRREAPARRDRLERRPVPVVGDRGAGARPRRRRPAAAARRCSRAGGSGPTPRTSPATTRSATTPARSGRTTRR